MTPADDWSRYRHLVALVRELGTRYEKKHGNWVRYDLDPEAGVFFQLDTWSSALNLKRGDRTMNAVLGFDAPTLERVGIDFGSFSLYVTRRRLESLIRAVEAREKLLAERRANLPPSAARLLASIVERSTVVAEQYGTTPDKVRWRAVKVAGIDPDEVVTYPEAVILPDGQEVRLVDDRVH